VLGWYFNIYRQANGGSEPARFSADPGPELARWDASFVGSRWLHALEKRGEAIDQGGQGYPTVYTAKAKYILPLLRPHGPSEPRYDEKAEAELRPGCFAYVQKFPAVIDACDPEEWLLIHMMDKD
jgi:hypothetical protein